jgi:hypothetical protein
MAYLPIGCLFDMQWNATRTSVIREQAGMEKTCRKMVAG